MITPSRSSKTWLLMSNVTKMLNLSSPNFFMFFDSLINSPTDVEILHKNGIINHVLGSHKNVANLFNKLCREIVYDLD